MDESLVHDFGTGDKLTAMQKAKLETVVETDVFTYIDEKQ